MPRLLRSLSLSMLASYCRRDRERKREEEEEERGRGKRKRERKCVSG
jgi:hypothetical protein